MLSNVDLLILLVVHEFPSTAINHVSNSIHCKHFSFLAAHHYTFRRFAD